MSKMDGPGIAAVGVGVIFIYGGVKGYSPIKAFQNLITGKNPNEGQSANLLTAESQASGNPSAFAPATGSQKDWIVAFLAALGAPNTSANVNSLTAWMRHEFGSWPPSSKNNPFASTEKMPSSTQYNSIGVQNYASVTDGIAANVKTMTNGRYNMIVNALRAGTGVCGNGFASEFNTWSGNGYSSVC